MDDWFLQRHGHPGTRHHLNILLGTKDKLIIGRKAGVAVDIVCSGTNVSRQHCYLKFVDNCWNVVDLESLNGTFINKVEIPANTPTSLKVGDVLGVGVRKDIDPHCLFLFDVCKNVTNAENEIGEEPAPVVPEIPNNIKSSPSIEDTNLKEKKQARNSLDVSHDDSDSGLHAPSTSKFVCEKFPSSTGGREEDDDVILLSSDEETVPQHHLQKKLEEIPSESDKSPSASKGCPSKPVSSSSEEDAPPDFSQTFSNEIESEKFANKDLQMKTSVPAKPTSNKDDDRLQELVSTGRFKPPEKTVKLIDPHSMPPRQLERPRKENDISQASNSQRTTKEIPMMSQKPKKKGPSKTSVKDKLAKEQDLNSYIRSVKDANSRPQGQSANSIGEGPSIFVQPEGQPKKKSPQKQDSNLPKPPKSSAPAPTKAKVTKRSRADKLTEALVGPSEEVNQQCSSGSNLFADENIAKKKKVSCDEGDEQLRENPSELDSIDESDMERCKAISFKPTPHRVGKLSVSDRPSNSTYSHKSSPRDEAQPLGRKRKWTRPFPKSTSNTLKKVQETDNEKIGNKEIEVRPSREEQSSMDCSETRISTEMSMDVALPQSTLADENRCLPIQCTPDVEKTGFSNQGLLCEPKKNVRFNNIKEIEAAPPNDTQSDTTICSVDIKTLTNDLLLRICNWNYNWIAEQQNAVNQCEPPFLLSEMKYDDNRIIPKLTLLPVVSAYHNLETYLDIFHPLMIHEIWANICKEVDSDHVELNALVHVTTDSVEGWAVLQCESVVNEGFSRFEDMDLVALTVPFSKPNALPKVFAIVDRVELRPIDGKEKINHGLLRSCPSPEYHHSFALRLKPSNVLMQFGNIFTVNRIMSLRTAIKQFHLTAELSRSLLCEVILHPSDFAEAFKLDAVEFENHEKLNPNQYKAAKSIARSITHAPCHEPKIALLQGPPGTGKSLVVVELVVRLILMNSNAKYAKRPRILICAPSNNAVDEITYRLWKTSKAMNSKFKIIRIGVPNSLHENVRNISLEILAENLLLKDAESMPSPEMSKLNTLKGEQTNLAKKKNALLASIEEANKRKLPDEARLHGRKLEALETQIESVERSYIKCRENHIQYCKNKPELQDKMKERVLLDADVICTTLNSCRSKEMELLFFGKNHERKHDFLCCIIDEASQCTEPESLTPLSLGISKLVLIGDEQLPATVASQSALKNRFDQSLFSRFYSSRMADDRENSEPVLMLNTQYRMAPSICEWPSKYFYGGKLVTALNLARSGPCYDYRVLNVIDGREKTDPKDGKSIMNEKEAHLVATAVQVILNSPLTKGKTVGVITFSQSQKQCIFYALETRFGKDVIDTVEVNTVDSFQGREKDIVIVSCAWARETVGDIRFMTSLQQMNVALTRAKESLIVCCHFPTLEANEAWNDLINNARNRGLAHLVTSDYTVTNLQPLLMRDTL